ncbi:hypothetical protein ACTG9Q_29120 [Actinokineospora sp. 24-640]
MTETTDLAAVRTRWQDIAKVPAAPVLRIALLASYTADPLTPYLGVALTDAGLAPQVRVAPFNQIVQQCLDDDSATARHRPDVLVVAPRLEELAADPADYAAELAHAVDAAAAAARRWRACLVVVLPAVPEHRARGALDDSLPGSVPAAAVAARELVRARLAERPDAWVVDAEQAVRAVGARAAHHPALFRFARIPYTESVFAELAAQIAGVLRAVFGATPRAVALAGTADAGLIAALRAAGARIGGWGPVGDAADLLDAWTPAADPAGLAAALGVPPDSLALIDATPAAGAPAAPGHPAGLAGDAAVVPGRSVGPAGDAVETQGHPVGLAGDTAVVAWPGPVVRLGPVAEAWPGELRRAGLLDRLPVPAPPPPAVAAVTEAATPSLADFVAGLRLEVECEPVRPDTAAKVAEVVSRAKDFTLGHDGQDLADPGRELIAVRVRDRFGDYGISGAVGVRRVGGERVVDVFSLSCVVLGKGVQDRVLAALRDGGPLAVRYRRTPHNQVATAFLAAADELRMEEVR